MKSWVFSAAIVLSLLSGCQIPAASPEKTESTAINTTHSSATQIIEHPQTTWEIFQNLKLVLTGYAMFDDPQLTLTRLETLYGQDWKKLTLDQMRKSDAIRQVIIMQYRKQEGIIYRRVDFEFTSEGYLRRALLGIYDSTKTEW